MEAERRIENGHRLVLEQRNRLEISGVRDVIAFDEQMILLETEKGELEITGEGFHMQQLILERGEISLEGRVDGLIYRESKEKKTSESFIRRLLR